MPKIRLQPKSLSGSKHYDIIIQRGLHRTQYISPLCSNKPCLSCSIYTMSVKASVVPCFATCFKHFAVFVACFAACLPHFAVCLACFAACPACFAACLPRLAACKSCFAACPPHFAVCLVSMLCSTYIALCSVPSMLCSSWLDEQNCIDQQKGLVELCHVYLFATV